MNSHKTLCASRFVCLMYHNVCDSRSADGGFPGFEAMSPSITNYFVDEETFERHCQSIAGSGQAMGFEELRRLDDSHDSQLSDSQLPRMLMTFDDGWRGTINIGGPILAKYEMEALLFVTTDLVGHPDFVDREMLQRLPPEFVVGSHAQTHRLLADLPDAQIEAELRKSKTMLEDILGREVDCLAYPGGSFDSRVQRIAEEAGYRWVFTSSPIVSSGTSGRLRIGRVAVKADTSVESVSRWLRGDLRKENRRALALNAAKRLMGRVMYHKLRTRILSEQSGQLEMTDLTEQMSSVQTS